MFFLAEHANACGDLIMLAHHTAHLMIRYVNEIIADLLKHVTDSQWRVREACCGAIADILRGRRWPELRDHIDTLWSKLFRALDDVKESVRIAAEAALKRIGKVTVGLCKAEAGSSGTEAVGKVLPVLINEGLLSSVKEIRAMALGVMLEVRFFLSSVVVTCFSCVCWFMCTHQYDQWVYYDTVVFVKVKLHLFLNFQVLIHALPVYVHTP